VQTITPLMAFSPPSVLGLDDHTQGLLNEMIVQWARKMPRNIERTFYLDGKVKIKDLGAVLPPAMVDKIEVVMGWPSKAVFEPANRITWEGLRSADESSDPFGLRRILHQNRFRSELAMSVVSALSQSLSFVTTTPGDTANGEPESLIMFHSALWATGLWDRRKRALKAALLINEIDPLGSPVQMTILTPTEQVICAKGGGGWYIDHVAPHRLGRTPMEMIPFRPTLERPYGRSRIDRQVMSLTDRAIRTATRLEVQSELYSIIKLILMGADEDAFTDKTGKKIPLWSFYASNVNLITKDEDGDVAKLETVKAESPEPHIATWRQLAADFSGHTGVPLSSLGIASDNPESEGAKRVAREDIVNDVESQHDVLDDVLLRVYENVIMIRDGLDAPPDGLMDVVNVWRPADKPTRAAMADAGAKQVAAIPGLEETEVGMEMVGMSPEQITRAQAELRRRRGSSILDRVLDRAGAAPGEPAVAEAE